jgi:hypothetical protein
MGIARADLTSSPLNVARVLATPWPAVPPLSTIHRLILLHYFLLPTTRHSPLTGGYVVTTEASDIGPYQGPSETNLTYLKEMEDAMLYAAVDSVRPEIVGSRIIEETGVDGRCVVEITESTA